VLYLNGALGSQIGPGQADVWQVDDAHLVGDGVTPPVGARPVDGSSDFRTRSMARTAANGDRLAAHVLELFVTAAPLDEVALGSVGLLFVPGELPPELVVGLPADFLSDTDAYSREPDLLCRQVTDDPASLSTYRPEIAAALVATCRYGQAPGRELGEPAGHYEVTNSAGWDLVDDTWAAALELFGR
jgi:hypothetical protein